LVLGEASGPEVVLALQLAALIYMLYSTSAVGEYTLLALEAIHVNLIVCSVGAILALSLIVALSGQMGLIGAVAGNAGYLITLILLPLGWSRLRAVSGACRSDSSRTGTA
jgi:O-antigen/teichoic acid export membrane protein